MLKVLKQNQAADAKAKKKSGAENRKARKEKEAVLEVDEQSKVYEIRSKGVLLTWQLPGNSKDFDTHGFFQGFQDLEIVKKVVRYSICIEEGSHLHAHAYVEFGARPETTIKAFTINGFPVSDVQCNGIKGSGYRVAADRGHFYVANEFKTTFVSNFLQYKPTVDYSVKTQWVLDQWGAGKIAHNKVVPCMAFYRCLTPSAEAMVKRTASVMVNLERKEWLEARSKRLAEKKQPFKKYAVAEQFRAQFEQELDRYKFIIIHGASRLGKTKLVESWYPNLFVHKNGISWNDYSPLTHDAICFEDCVAIDEYILRHKVLFQSGSVTKVNLSKTNCFELEVDTAEKPIIIMVNELPVLDEWIKANSFILHIDSPTWGMSALEDEVRIEEAPRKKLKQVDDTVSKEALAASHQRSVQNMQDRVAGPIFGAPLGYKPGLDCGKLNFPDVEGEVVTITREPLPMKRKLK